MGDLYPSDEKDLKAFAEDNCLQTQLLFSHAEVGECDADELAMRVDNVNVRRRHGVLRTANAYNVTRGCFRPPAASKREILYAQRAPHGHVRLS